jgi:hypothetical protein
MNGRTSQDHLRGILRRVVAIAPLFAVTLLMSSHATQAVVDPTPTPGMQRTGADAQLRELSWSRTLDPSSSPDEPLPAWVQPVADEQSAAADGAAPLH